MKLVKSYIQNGHVFIERGNICNRVLLWVQKFSNLTFIRWANVRNEWYFHILISPLLPVGILIFMKLAGAVQNPMDGLYITAGNAIMGIIIGPMQSISNDLAWGRQRRDIDFFAVLPISKLQLVLGFTIISAIFTIPGMLLTLCVGKLWLKFPIVFHGYIFPVMILAGFSMVGVGVLIGVYARNGHHANIMNTIVMMVVMFISPVLIPIHNLPLFLRYTSKLFPTSYAASAFRLVLMGRINTEFFINIGILLLFTIVTLFFAVKRLDWRVEA